MSQLDVQGSQDLPGIEVHDWILYWIMNCIWLVVVEL